MVSWTLLEEWRLDLSLKVPVSPSGQADVLVPHAIHHGHIRLCIVLWDFASQW
jgi:hypothetical protein